MKKMNILLRPANVIVCPFISGGWLVEWFVYLLWHYSCKIRRLQGNIFVKWAVDNWFCKHVWVVYNGKKLGIYA